KRALINPMSIVVVVLAAFAVYLYFFLDQGPEVQEERDQTVPVRVQVIEQTEFRDIIEALGTAQANESVVVTPQSQEIVQAIYFDDGDIVERGQLLVQLDSREESARVQELEFRLGESERQFERLQSLARENVASRRQLEEQDVLVKQTAAELEVARTRLESMRILAPFGGQLGIRNISVGALVGPGDEITTLDDTSTIKVDFAVPEIYFASL